MLSCQPGGHGARPCFGTACALVPGFGVHMPDVGENEKPAGQTDPRDGTGSGRSSARAADGSSNAASNKMIRIMSSLLLRSVLEAQPLVGNLLDHGGDALQARPRLRVRAVAHSGDGVTENARGVRLRHAGRVEPACDGVAERVEAQIVALQTERDEPLAE